MARLSKTTQPYLKPIPPSVSRSSTLCSNESRTGKLKTTCKNVPNPESALSQS